MYKNISSPDLCRKYSRFVDFINRRRAFFDAQVERHGWQRKESDIRVDEPYPDRCSAQNSIIGLILLKIWSFVQLFNINKLMSGSSDLIFLKTKLIFVCIGFIPIDVVQKFRSSDNFCGKKICLIS